MTRDENVAMHLKSMEDHKLERVSGPPVESFYMKRPRSRMFSTLITFTREGIVIGGDFCPGHHGVVSALGYGLGWFLKPLSPDYLCSKFLERVWCDDIAEGYIQQVIQDLLDEDPADALAEQLQSAVEYAHDWHSHAYNETFAPLLQDAGYDSESVWPSYWYSASDWAALVAIQRKFAELWKTCM